MPNMMRHHATRRVRTKVLIRGMKLQECANVCLLTMFDYSGSELTTKHDKATSTTEMLEIALAAGKSTARDD